MQNAPIHARTHALARPTGRPLASGAKDVFLLYWRRLSPVRFDAVRALSERVAAFPGSLTQFQQPALPVRVEECVREVVAVVLGDLERLVLDALVQILQ